MLLQWTGKKIAKQTWNIMEKKMAMMRTMTAVTVTVMAVSEKKGTKLHICGSSHVDDYYYYHY